MTAFDRMPFPQALIATVLGLLQLFVFFAVIAAFVVPEFRAWLAATLRRFISTDAPPTTPRRLEGPRT